MTRNEQERDPEIKALLDPPSRDEQSRERAIQRIMARLDSAPQTHTVRNNWVDVAALAAGVASFAVAALLAVLESRQSAEVAVSTTNQTDMEQMVVREEPYEPWEVADLALRGESE